MELLLTDEQRMLQESAAGQIADLGGVKRTRAWRGKGAGYDRAMLERFAAEGWLGILVPADLGGLGLGVTELAVVMLEAGRHLAPEPIAACALAAASVAAVDPALAERIAAGSAVVAAGFDGSRIGARACVETSKSGADQSARLNGTAAGVAFADGAVGFLVEVAGAGLAWVDGSSEGVEVVHSPSVDGRPLSRITFRDVPARMLPGGAVAADQLFNRTILLASAELVGVMSAALDMTVEYLKTRVQFGRPIGSFQALQHRAVDDFTRIVSSRSFLFQVLAQGDAATSAMAAAVKSYVSGEALALTKSAIQMHGGIGFTDEHDIGLYLKRAMWLSAAYGNAAVQRQRFTALTSAT